jgi:hypothetical protein
MSTVWVGTQPQFHGPIIRPRFCEPSEVVDPSSGQGSASVDWSTLRGESSATTSDAVVDSAKEEDGIGSADKRARSLSFEEELTSSVPKKRRVVPKKSARQFGLSNPSSASGKLEGTCQLGTSSEATEPMGAARQEETALERGISEFNYSLISICSICNSFYME